MYGLGAYYMVKGDQCKALEVSTKYLQFTDSLSDLDARISAHFLYGIMQTMRGYLTEALEHLTRSLDLIGPSYRENQLERFGQDFKASALCWKTRTLWYLGYPDQAAHYLQRSLDYAGERNHPYCWGWAYGNAGFMSPLIGADHDLYVKGVEHCEEHGYSQWVALMAAGHGGNLIWQGNAQEALGLINEAIAMCRGMGIDLWMSWHLALKASALLALEDSKTGLAVIEQAMVYTDNCDELVSLSEIYRVQGELFLIATPPQMQDAKASFERGLAIARAQGGKSFELRTSTTYARFLSNQGRTNEARDLLHPIYDWFTEGFGTKDLKEAKALLDTLV